MGYKAGDVVKLHPATLEAKSIDTQKSNLDSSSSWCELQSWLLQVVGAMKCSWRMAYDRLSVATPSY